MALFSSSNAFFVNRQGGLVNNHIDIILVSIGIQQGRFNLSRYSLIRLIGSIGFLFWRFLQIVPAGIITF
jgi:hypothetical protein